MRENIATAAREACRDPAAITLIGVAKSQSHARVSEAVDAGLNDLGENYVQEARDHAALLSGRALRWHFIGMLQTNKTRAVAETFDWVHTVDRARIAERLSAQRPANLPPLSICIQVRLGDEPTKGGVLPTHLEPLAARIAGLPRLSLRGLMALPPEESEVAHQRRWFAALRQMLDRLNDAGHRLDSLSMGMSGDYRAAIAEGATHLRIGTAVFGERG